MSKVPKPAACNGCPLRSASDWMVPDEIVPGSQVYLQCSSEFDKTTEDVFFPLAGLVRGENVSIGRTIRCNGGDVSNRAALNESIVHCTRAHYRPPATARLVIAQGALSWQAWTGGAGLSIGDWRGFLAPSTSVQHPLVYAVLEPSDLKVGKQPELTLPSKLDWAKIPKILNGEWPKPFPPAITSRGSGSQCGC